MLVQFVRSISFKLCIISLISLAPLSFSSTEVKLIPIEINAVIEIPAGTHEKWEYYPPAGKIVHEIKDGKPRVIQYLAYPVNYGYVPFSLLPKNKGGDGDPLDIIVLGPTLERGESYKVRVIGILKLMDRGEIDDKLIAVIPRGIYKDVDDLYALNRKYPGITEIIKLWFANYKGRTKIEILGYGNIKEANKMIEQALSYGELSEH